MERCGDCIFYATGLCLLGEKWGHPNAPAPRACFIPDTHAAETEQTRGVENPRSRRVGETGEGVRP